MAKTALKTRTKVKAARPRLYKIILLNDDYTPREFVIQVLQGIFRISFDQASRVMITAHQKGSCVVTVCPQEIAESKAKEGTETGRRYGFPLMFTTEPEE
jgi:ATP-dependent Clp protease adaptor protein ClpS